MNRDRRVVELQCQGEHRVGNLICYCQLPMGHKDLHLDYRGRRWAKLFAWPAEPVAANVDYRKEQP